MKRPKRRVWHCLGPLLSIKCRKIIKKTHTQGPNDARRVVWALFPLRGPALAFLAAVGLRGLSWASSGPMRGVAGVVQPADVVTYLRNGPNDARRVVWAAQTCLRRLGPLLSIKR